MYLNSALRFYTGGKIVVIICSVRKCIRIRGLFFFKASFYTKEQMIHLDTSLNYVSCTQISKC